MCSNKILEIAESHLEVANSLHTHQIKRIHKYCRYISYDYVQHPKKAHMHKTKIHEKVASLAECEKSTSTKSKNRRTDTVA